MSRQPRRPATDSPTLDHNGLTPYLKRFLDHSAALGLSPQTVTVRQRMLQRFIYWCEERSLERPQDITRPILERYRRHTITAKPTANR